MSNKASIAALLVLIFIFLSRLVGVGRNPPSLYWDEASIGYEAYSISKTGKDMHGNSWFQPIYPAYGDYKAPTYIIVTAFFMRFFPPTNTVIRLSAVLASVVTAIGIYLISKEVTNNKLHTLVTLAVVAILPWHFHFSRIGYEANLALMFVTLGVVCLLKSRQKGWWLLLGSLNGAMAVYSYFSARIAFPLIALSVISIYFNEFKNKVVWVITSGLLFLLLLMPLRNSPYYQASNQFRLSTSSILQNDKQVIYANILREQDQNSLLSRLLHHRYTYTLKELLINVGDHLSFEYLFFSGDPNPRHSTGVVGVMLPTMIPLFIAGLISYWKVNRRLVLFLLLWWAVSLLPASIPETTPHGLRSLTALPAIVLILAQGVTYLVKKSKNTHQVKLNFIYIALVVLNFITFLHYYITQYPNETAHYWQDGNKQLAEFVSTHRSSFDHIFITDSDRLHLYLLLYLRIPPEKIQTLPQEYFTSPLIPNKFENITIGKINWNIHKFPIKSLVIVEPNNTPSDKRALATIADHTGTIKFIAYDGQDLQ